LRESSVEEVEDPQHSLRERQNDVLVKQASFEQSPCQKGFAEFSHEKYRLHEDLVKHGLVAILESFAWTLSRHLTVNPLLQWSRPWALIVVHEGES
jgi:hypothetical protein